MRWESRKGGRVMRWQGEKGGRVVRWEGRRFFVLFKDGEHRVSLRCYLLLCDVNQRNKGYGLKISFHPHSDGKTLLRTSASY